MHPGYIRNGCATASTTRSNRHSLIDRQIYRSSGQGDPLIKTLRMAVDRNSPAHARRGAGLPWRHCGLHCHTGEQHVLRVVVLIWRSL